MIEERNIKKRNLKAIQADFEKSKKVEKVPDDLKNFKLILDKYGIDEVCLFHQYSCNCSS
jgi:hypothetical protein